jgi:hypothetical protein
MTELLRINAKYFIYINTTLGIITILICYIIAQFLNHVNSILPMISDCFVYEPENYIARFGVISFINFGNLISNVLIANFVSTNDFINKILICISFINSFCFGCVGAISEIDNIYVHNVFALGGYISYAVYLSIIWFTSLESNRNIMTFPYIIVLLLKIFNAKPLIEWSLTLLYSFNIYKFSSLMSTEYIVINTLENI